MCTYDGAAYLQEQLDSLAGQTRLPDELIVCDDRSSDSTMALVDAFAVQAPFPVRLYVNDTNLGSTKNFEKAIGLCTGDIIGLSDQDDVWHPNKLSRMEGVFLSSPRVGLVFADAELVDEQLRPFNRRLLEQARFTERRRRLLRKGRAFDVLLTRNIANGASMAFLSKFRELVLPIAAAALHDYWIASLIAPVAEVAFLDEPLMKYRLHSRQQIGMHLKSSFGDVWAAARRNDFSASDVTTYKQIRDRLLDRGDVANRQDFDKLEAKIAHLTTRIRLLRRGTFTRIPVVLKELRRGNYHHYSNGLSSAARDLIG